MIEGVEPKYEKGQEEEIMSFGALRYSAKRISVLLKKPLSDIEDLMKNESSQFKQLYTLGAYQADYEIHTRLLELAMSGDIKAIEKLEKTQLVVQNS